MPNRHDASAALHAQIETLLAARQGHFALESGHHGNRWLDLERLFLHPKRVQPIATALADRLAPHGVETCAVRSSRGASWAVRRVDAPRPVHVHRARTATRGCVLFPWRYVVPKSLQPELRAGASRRQRCHQRRVGGAGDARRARDTGRAPRRHRDAGGLGRTGAALATERAVALETLASLPNDIWGAEVCPFCGRGARSPTSRRACPPFRPHPNTGFRSPATSGMLLHAHGASPAHGISDAGIVRCVRRRHFERFPMSVKPVAMHTPSSWRWHPISPSPTWSQRRRYWCEVLGFENLGSSGPAGLRDGAARGGRVLFQPCHRPSETPPCAGRVRRLCARERSRAAARELVTSVLRSSKAQWSACTDARAGHRRLPRIAHRFRRGPGARRLSAAPSDPSCARAGARATGAQPNGGSWCESTTRSSSSATCSDPSASIAMS